MRTLFLFLACSFAVLPGCGGRVATEEGAGVDAGAREVLLGAGDAAFVPPAPVCIKCAADGDCGGPGMACVATPGGGGYCAPGCTKEGFCTPERDCTIVSSPSGETWKACVPTGGGCGG